MDSCRLKLVSDSVEDVPESVEEVLNSVKEVIAGSEEVFTDSLVPPDSVDVLVSDEFAPFSASVVADSVEEVIAGSEEVFTDSLVASDLEDVLVEEVADSVQDVLDDELVVHCPRCGTFHAGGVFGEACFQALWNARRCARCGLLHEDYDVPAKWLHLMDMFDCEFYIPDVDKLEMDGTRIRLTNEVMKKLDEHVKKQQAKITKQE